MEIETMIAATALFFMAFGFALGAIVGCWALLLTKSIPEDNEDQWP